MTKVSKGKPIETLEQQIKQLRRAQNQHGEMLEVLAGRIEELRGLIIQKQEAT
jgi:prefoldin subunit 5